MEESDPIGDPLAALDSDYDRAVLHLAWNRASVSKHRTLIFAFVELVPREIPPPIDDYDPLRGKRLLGDSEHYAYVRHAVVSARQAIDWYRACRGGVAVLPDDEGRLPMPSEPGAKKLRLMALAEEPPWPELVCAYDTSDVLPFCPAWIECPRVHHLLPASPFEMAALWSKEGEQKAALRYFEEHLHFSFSLFPEYLGSAHLVAPNPVLRTLDVRLQERTPPAEAVLFRATARRGRSLAALDLVLYEPEPWGLKTARRMTLHGPLARANFARAVGFAKYEVIDGQRGVLYASENGHSFLAAVGLNMQFARTMVVVGGTPEDSFEVSRTGSDSDDRVVVTVGSPAPISLARSRMYEAHSARKQRAEGARLDQRWFGGQQQREARRVVRALLHGATREVLVVDPYASAGEVSAFLLAVGNERVPIKLLTSSKVLGTRDEQGTERGDVLASLLHSLVAQGYQNAISVRAMPGDPPEIHDRFILVDERIWLLGSSLNEFGSRGTMMVSIPDPNLIRDHLHEAWLRAEPLEAWARRRAQTRAKEGRPT